ncbi:MAG: hypothetical protein HQM13_23910 [SAR324 cluster bacterium]|nr:hypothetical protein [SAR324 cluster bacterium]
MSLSGYKVEALLKDFRERYGYKRIAEHRVDLLQISDEAQFEAQRLQSYLTRSKRVSQWVSPQEILELIADSEKYEAIIEYEQQRRAGLFVEPNYLPPDPPPPMNLVRDYSEAIEKARMTAEKPPAEMASEGTQQSAFETEKTEPEQNKQTDPPKKKEKSLDLKLELDEDAAIEDFAVLEEESSDDDANVVFGFGKITAPAMIEFIHSNPDSALKFMAQRDLDGKHLASEIADVHEMWRQRGLSRKLIRDYILNILEWQEWPEDKQLMDVWSELGDAIYDLMHHA